MSQAHSTSKVRFSPEVSRSHSPDHWGAEASEDDQQSLLPKPLPSTPRSMYNNRIRGTRERRWSDVSASGGRKAWVKLGMTFAFGTVLLVLGIVFGVIFWENEGEGTGGFGLCAETP